MSQTLHGHVVVEGTVMLGPHERHTAIRTSEEVIGNDQGGDETGGPGSKAG